MNPTGRKSALAGFLFLRRIFVMERISDLLHFHIYEAGGNID
jgi:hypothetical protein